MTFDSYYQCLFSGEDEYRTMNIIRSYKHEVYTEQMNKKSLSSEDDKRVILPDNISIYAYGHWRIKHLEDN